MSRIRSIKPEFWTDPTITRLPYEARLLFIGTWNHADDYGVVKDDPDELRLKILPADNIDPHALIDLLVSVRCLTRKTASDGTPVLVIRTFEANQKIDRRAAGRYGDPAGFSDPTTTDGLTAIATDPAESPPIPTNPILGREGKGRELIRAANPQINGSAVPRNGSSPSGDGDCDFDAWWEQYPKKLGKDAARRSWTKATTGKHRATAELLITKIGEHKRFWKHNGTEDQFIPYPATWLNGRRWEDELTPPKVDMLTPGPNG